MQASSRWQRAQLDLDADRQRLEDELKQVCVWCVLVCVVCACTRVCLASGRVRVHVRACAPGSRATPAGCLAGLILRVCGTQKELV